MENIPKKIKKLNRALDKFEEAWKNAQEIEKQQKSKRENLTIMRVNYVDYVILLFRGDSFKERTIKQLENRIKKSNMSNKPALLWINHEYGTPVIWNRKNERTEGLFNVIKELRASQDPKYSSYRLFNLNTYAFEIKELFETFSPTDLILTILNKTTHTISDTFFIHDDRTMKTVAVYEISVYSEL